MTKPYKDITTLIPDLLPQGHIPLNMKRVQFLRGQGAIIYNEKYAVEIYTARFDNDNDDFFAVHKHEGNLDELRQRFSRVRLLHVNDRIVSARMKKQFEEAIFHLQPIEVKDSTWVFPKVLHPISGRSKAKEIVMNTNFIGAA